MLKVIPAQEDATVAKERALPVIEKLRAIRLARVAEIIESGIEKTLSYYSRSREHWRCLRTNNPLELLRGRSSDEGAWSAQFQMATRP